MAGKTFSPTHSRHANYRLVKPFLATCVIITVFFASPLHSEETPITPSEDTSEAFTSPLMPGMKGSYETLEATIEKVYSAENNGFKYRSYVVKWQGQEVVISDMMAISEKQVGDKLTFMVQEIEMPAGGKSIKMLQFMVMDMEGYQKLGAEMLDATKTTAPVATPESKPSTPQKTTP